MTANDMMIAMRVHEFGPPDAIVQESIPIPPLEPDEVLVRVHAAGVGPWDGWVRSGRSVLPQPLPLTLGSDIAGVVESLGRDVTGLSVGDEVYGVTNARFTGGYPEYAACKAGMIARKPRNLSFVEAASAPVVAVTAWQMLFDEAKLKAGQVAIIQGAAGSVGRYAVMLARSAGIHVIASALQKDLDQLRELGAHEVTPSYGARPVRGNGRRRHGDLQGHPERDCRIAARSDDGRRHGCRQCRHRHQAAPALDG